MNKEELYIINSNGERLALDLPSPSGITLKWVSNLFSDISKITCSYSYTFKLPMTANNRRVLDIVDDIRRNTLIAKKSVQAEFYINGVCLCPNANLYVSEINSAYSCVMTWRVLKAFEKLKSDKGKLTELQSLGRITWGKDELYGGTDDTTSNMDSVVYPDYDAGVPHEEDTPPKPCVPVYKIIQLINEKYGVKFNIGSYIAKGMGKKPNSYLNNTSYYKRRVYDDYVSNGVIPLVNSTINGSKFAIKSISSIGNFTYKTKTLEFTQKWSVARFTLSGGWSLFHYGIIEGTYTSLTRQDSEQLQAEYEEPKIIAVDIVTFEEFSGNEYVKPVFGYLHDTGLSYYTCVKWERAEIRRKIDEFGAKATWGTRTYAGEEYIGLELNTDKSVLKEMRSLFDVTEDSLHYNVTNMQYKDNGYKLGVVGFYTKYAFTLKGSCELHITKAAVDEGRIDVSGYMWICLAKKSSDNEDLDVVTKKDISSYSGFQSLDSPTFEASSNSYVCHFDFGKIYDARKISIDADDDETLQAYMFLPYIPDDHMIEVTIPAEEEGGTETTETVLNIQEGDIYIEGLYISELAPQVEVSSLPTNLQITESLPDITCFDFMKSVFYMNGAIPRVECDGSTISAAYYNELRDRINDGNVLDWSKKLIAGNGQMASSIKFRNTNFARTNYFEMATSTVDSTEEELAEELDVYGNGYGSLTIDDDNLNESATIFTSCFYPAYIQNMRFPLVKVGRTCKVWEGDNTLVDDVKPIYGVMVYRTLDPQIEDVNVSRPGLLDVTTYHKRMNVFSPFDDEAMMTKFFGYYQSILNDYRLVKEKFLLNEFDLRNFDESMPVYLSKYNAYFAVSTIQRDKSGVCTVELVKLPISKESTESVNDEYEVELMVSGYLEVDAGKDDTSTIYCKKTSNSEWEKLTNTKLNIFKDEYYTITADNEATYDPILRLRLSYVGQYKFTYTDADTGEKKSIIRNESSAYYDGMDWNDNNDKYIYDGDQDWHKVEIVIPIRNQYGEIIETRRWTSPIFASSKDIANHGLEETRTVVSVDREMNLKINLERTYTTNPCPILADGGETSTYNSELKVVNREPTYAQPNLEGANYMKNDSYTMEYSVYASVEYTITKRKGFSIVSKENFTTKLRTYYDDVRITKNGIVTFTKSEFGQYHTFKFIADLVDNAGNIIEKLRHRMVWFVYGVDKSVLSLPFGDEHDGDTSVKVNDVTIDGINSIADMEPHKYTLSYAPTYADVGVKSVAVSVVEKAISLGVSDVSTESFTLTANDLPDSETTVTILVTVRLEDGSSFEKEKALSILKPSFYLYEPSMEAVDGSGTKDFRVYVRPNDDGGTITDVKTDSNNVTANVSGNRYFTLSAHNVTEDVNLNVTVTMDYKGMTISGVLAISITAKDTWSIKTLDNAGVLIVDRNGKFYTKEEWVKSGVDPEDADGIALSDGTHRFIIAKKNVSNIGVWASGTLIEGIVTTDDTKVALQDFDGKANTSKIANALTDSFAAKLLQRKNDFPSGKSEYCGALGEWKLIGSKRSQINVLMNTIGADELFWDSNDCDYFSTTQYNAYTSWVAHFGANVELIRGSKGGALFVRPLAEISEAATPVPYGNMEIVGGDSFKAVNGNGSADFTISYSPDGVSISEVEVSSNNSAVVVTQVSNEKFNLSVSGIIANEVATITVKARLNNLIHKTTKVITAIGEVVVNYDKLDAEKALVLTKDYALYTEDEWYASKKSISDVEGIAVSDGTHRIIMSIKDAGRCCFGGRNMTIDGLSTDTKLYNGKSNTDAIVKAITKPDGYFTNEPYSAAAVARNFIFPTGKAGFLASYAEWALVDKYYEQVETLLTAVGGDALMKNYSFTYWASTAEDSIRNYCYHCYLSEYSGKVHEMGNNRYRSDSSTVRPFRNF